MNGLTILLWATILIIGLISIIGVKLHYKGAELEKDEGSIIPTDAIKGIVSYGQNKIKSDKKSPNHNTQLGHANDTYPIEEENYIEPQVETNNYKNIEYSSQNQVLINYGNEIQNFQEPMTENQVEIMTQDNEKHELKDLFTIDELIKESKRKDSEREKESQQIKNDDDDDLTELKESIRKRRENEEAEEKLVEEIPVEKTEETVKEPTIQEIIEQPQEETVKEPTIQEIIEQPQEETIQEVLEVEEEAKTVEDETPSVTSQKDIAEAIDNASQEIQEKEEVESISESENITDVLLNSEEEEIKEPVLKSPTKIDEKTEEFDSQIDNSNLYTPKEENELDYRKDLAKITNTIKSSRLFQDVKDRIKGETPNEYHDPLDDIQESYIRNVNEFEENYVEEYVDEYEPIINETHDEFGEIYEPEISESNYEQAIREENTRRLFNNARSAPEPELAEPKIDAIKPKPSRDNIKIQMGNADIVLKKGDEIIFRHDGETYSSQVFAINGDDISVKYRRKNITIKPEDVKKVY